MIPAVIRNHPVPVLAVVAALTIAAPAPAQHSPYADHADREIKGLSSGEVEWLLSGEGMGQALPAELNGYPGPKHVLELAAQLELTEEQRDAASKAYDAMLREAMDLGFEIVAAERRLDHLFALAEATPEALRAALDRLATLRASLRYAHLAAHLETHGLLTRAQLVRYDELRGYAGGHEGHGRPDHGQHPEGR